MQVLQPHQNCYYNQGKDSVNKKCVCMYTCIHSHKHTHTYICIMCIIHTLILITKYLQHCVLRSCFGNQIKIQIMVWLTVCLNHTRHYFNLKNRLQSDTLYKHKYCNFTSKIINILTTKYYFFTVQLHYNNKYISVLIILDILFVRYNVILLSIKFSY